MEAISTKSLLKKTRSLLKKGDRQPFSPEADSDNLRVAAAKNESVPIFQQSPSVPLKGRANP
jgi:hypothetical protein